jgi:signal peptidase I
MKKTLNIIIGIFSWILIGSFTVILGMTLLSNFDLLRGYRSFLVQSGSMEPSIMMGDVVITTKTRQYHQNDVVTFRDNDGRTVTHRVIGTDETNYSPMLVTKGDANQTKDRHQITTDQVLGKVSLVVPKLGFVIAFSRTPVGFLILVIIPAGIIAIDEIKGILKKLKKGE